MRRMDVAGIPVNYTEARVGNYTLPNPLMLLNGKAGARRQDLDQKAPAGNRAACSRKTSSAAAPAVPRDELRRVRQGYAGLRRKGHPPAGDDLLLQGQRRARDGPADLSAGRRQEAGAAAAEPRLLRELPDGRRSRRQSWAKSGAGRRRECRLAGGRRFGQAERRCRCWSRDSAWPPSITATSIRTSWAVFPLACGAST